MPLPSIFKPDDPPNVKEAVRLIELEFPGYQVLSFIVGKEVERDGKKMADVQLLGGLKDRKWPILLRSIADALQSEFDSP
jgi:hypothetical protein